MLGTVTRGPYTAVICIKAEGDTFYVKILLIKMFSKKTLPLNSISQVN